MWAVIVAFASNAIRTAPTGATGSSGSSSRARALGVRQWNRVAVHEVAEGETTVRLTVGSGENKIKVLLPPRSEVAHRVVDAEDNLAIGHVSPQKRRRGEQVETDSPTHATFE